MVRGYCRLNGHEVEQTWGDSEGQGSLACYSSWGCKEMDATQQLKHNNIVTVSRMLRTVIYEKPFLVLDGGSDLALSHPLCFSAFGFETHFVFSLLRQPCCSLSLLTHSLEERKNHGKEMSLNRTAAKSTILVKIIQLCSHIVRHLERSLKKII